MTLPDITTLQWVFAFLSAACIGLSKTGFGGIAVPGILLMAQVLPVRESTGVVLPLLILADLYAIRAFRSYVKWKVLLKLLPPAVIGIVLAWFLMPLIPAHDFGPLIGWLIIALLVVAILQKLSPHLQKIAGDHPAIAWPLGLIAGCTTMIANASGAVVTIYLLACRLPKYEFVGTGAWFFFIMNVIKVPFSASLGLITPSTLIFNFTLIPGIACGLILGRFLLGKINQQAFEWTLLGISLLGSLRLVFQH